MITVYKMWEGKNSAVLVDGNLGKTLCCSYIDSLWLINILLVFLKTRQSCHGKQWRLKQTSRHQQRESGSISPLLSWDLFFGIVL